MAIISRHDRLFQTLARVARLCGIVVELEPRLDGKDKSRTDGHFFFHSITTHVDISVVNPTVKDYLKLAQEPPGAEGRYLQGSNSPTRLFAFSFCFRDFWWDRSTCTGIHRQSSGRGVVEWCSEPVWYVGEEFSSKGSECDAHDW